MSNIHLNMARVAKNDEYYTQYTDIEAELEHYRGHFLDKTVYCNCDNIKSNFWKYFHINFQTLGLKRLIATYYDPENTPYKLEYSGGCDDDVASAKRTQLEGNGDFRSQECAKILEHSDIVVTNPPFSHFRCYVQQLITYGKDFVIVGSVNAMAYKDLFPLVQAGRVYVGYNRPRKFQTANGGYRNFGNIIWYTSLNTPKHNRSLELHRSYYSDPSYYQILDNWEALNVDKVKDIPLDYFGVLAVPISFMEKYDPDVWSIRGITETWGNPELSIGKPYRAILNEKKKFSRVLIQRRTA